MGTAACLYRCAPDGEPVSAVGFHRDRIKAAQDRVPIYDSIGYDSVGDEITLMDVLRSERNVMPGDAVFVVGLVPHFKGTRLARCARRTTV
jgi:hypothetical protein